VANWHIEDNLTLMKQLGGCKFITPGLPGVMRKSYSPDRSTRVIVRASAQPVEQSL
jgi:hypothetical protein